jgi:hypothetical protein
MKSSGLLDCIDEKNGRASKWDLIKVVGNESQFHYWVEEFRLKDKLVEEPMESDHHFYKKIETANSCRGCWKTGKSCTRCSSQRKET